MQHIKSLFIWAGIILLIIAWLPIIIIARLLDWNKTRYRTGYLFRRLGKAISRINPFWKITISDLKNIDDRQPYVMVSNHLSNADIPVIANLPWEMKWTAKKELFDLPFVGWMMSLAGDIPVDRRSSAGKASAIKRAVFYLRNRTSVIFFPEGTRSADGHMRRFSKGAFDLAIREQVPVLPMVIDGTHGCLPKNSWIFKPDVHAKLVILDPVPTEGLGEDQVDELMATVRGRMKEELDSLRGK